MDIDVFSYTDYRKFLKDLYELNKQRHSFFSYRYLAKKAGFSSPNFIKLVMDGKRNLSTSSIETLSGVFKLNKIEGEFFKDLVLMNQAADSVERKVHADRLFNSRVFKKVHQLNQDQYAYYTHWYYIAIRELVGTEGFRSDPVWIGRKLKPEVSPADVRAALEALERMELIKKTPEGNYVHPVEVISTGNEISSIAVAQFHRNMFELASRSIDSVSRERRDISSVTVGLSEEGMKEFKQAIQKFRKEMLALAERDQGRTQVYQMGIQFFPLTEKDVQ